MVHPQEFAETRKTNLRPRQSAMRKTKSSILGAVHDTAKGLHKIGAMDDASLREFDRLCQPTAESPESEQIMANKVSRLPSCKSSAKAFTKASGKA